MHGAHNAKNWAKTQTIVCLSSGKYELRGISDGVAQALGIQTIARDLGFTRPIKMLIDAMAAIAIARRRGMGRIRHIDVTDLWVQEKLTTKAKTIDKVLGGDKPADIRTKHVDRQTLNKALQRMGLQTLDVISSVAPAVIGVQAQLMSLKQRTVLSRFIDA